MGDEEVHVVAAMLRNNATIEEIQFRKNKITDDGARALAAVLAERSALKFIDLRENNISMSGVKVIADALERSERIHKVMVHPGGKIEAFGASETIHHESETTAFAVKTACIVDLREQRPQQPKPNIETTTKEQQASRQSNNKAKNKSVMKQSPSVKKTKQLRAASADGGSKATVAPTRTLKSAPNKSS